MSSTTSNTVSFATHLPWNRSATNAPQVNRPYAEVLVGPNRLRVWCLVDSGADKIMLDSGLAGQAGVSLAGTPSYPVTTAGGLVTVNEVTGVSLEIEGNPITDDCLFAPGAMPLLGRVTFLNAFKGVGLDINGWLYK